MYYVSPTGSNSNSGQDRSFPLADLNTAIRKLGQNGGVVVMMSGEYSPQKISNATNVVIAFEDVSIDGGMGVLVSECKQAGAIAHTFALNGEEVPADVSAGLLTRSLSSSERQTPCIKVSNSTGVHIIPAPNNNGQRLRLYNGGRGIHFWECGEVSVIFSEIFSMIDRGIGGSFEKLSVADCLVYHTGCVDWRSRITTLKTGDAGPPAAVAGWWSSQNGQYKSSGTLEINNCLFVGENGGETIGGFHLEKVLVQNSVFHNSSDTVVLYAEQCAEFEVKNCTATIDSNCPRKVQRTGNLQVPFTTRLPHIFLCAREGTMFQPNTTKINIDRLSAIGGDTGIKLGWSGSGIYPSVYELEVENSIVMGQENFSLYANDSALTGTGTISNSTLNSKIVKEPFHAISFQDTTIVLDTQDQIPEPQTYTMTIFQDASGKLVADLTKVSESV